MQQINSIILDLCTFYSLVTNGFSVQFHCGHKTALNNKVFKKKCAHTLELVSCLAALGTLHFGTCAKPGGLWILVAMPLPSPRPTWSNRQTRE